VSIRHNARVTGWEGQLGLIQVNKRTKMIIIIVLKSRLEGRPGTRSRSWVGLTIDLSQQNDKYDYYHNLKTDLGVDTGQEGQCKDKKNSYYHNFKTRFGINKGQGLDHRLRGLTRVDLSQHMDKYIIIIILKPDLRIDLG